jgi:two-component system, OmpR family, sensor histidine kinase KdpD
VLPDDATPRAGSAPAALAAALSFLGLDYFFIPPYHTFSVARSDHVLTLFVYLGVAVVTGQLVARVRERGELAERERRRLALLYDLNAALVGDATTKAILETVVEQVSRLYGAACSRILLADDDGPLTVHACFPPNRRGASPPQRLAAASSVPGRDVMGSRRRSGPPPGGGRLSAPILVADRPVGILDVTGCAADRRFTEEDAALLKHVAGQTALALERARLTNEAARTAILARSDELKSALLAAVSHDLRTPLAAIKASATSLLDPDVAWTEADRREFYEAIDAEADRLSRMVSNLLDLSRIEGGALKPDKAWYDVAELVDDVANRMLRLAADHPLQIEAAPELPLVCFDYIEIAQVLTNLLENAVKHTPPGTPITLAARRVPGAIELAVRDRGPGIPPSEQARLFEKFYRAPSANGRPGVGIGLAIAKGLVEAHGGQLGMESQFGRGTTFRFTLPLAADAVLPAAAAERGAPAPDRAEAEVSRRAP